MDKDQFPIFLVATPGFENALHREAGELGFSDPRPVFGGVEISGGWSEVWRANLELRGAGRVLVRIDSFRASHLAQLDKRTRAVAWGDVLRKDIPVRVEASCRKSKIYHSGAAAERVEKAIAQELGAPIESGAQVRVLVRIENDLCTISVDTSGEGLHRRGHKLEVNKAPMRETTAALLLRECGYSGSEPVVDPMCGSGTFVIEAAEMALGLKPGRARGFAFEHLARFNPDMWAAMKAQSGSVTSPFFLCGSDRDAGAIRMSLANAERAGVSSATRFAQTPIDELEPPEGPAGLVIVNPPYGLRIGDRKKLYPLYGALGTVMRTRFSGWRLGMVTADPALARATGLTFEKPGGSIDNNGVRITLYKTGILQ
ncbi:THUMP domain-containing class I SAM-dependent RNA methyltransferase [Pelagibacterium halotolerans]|uniref:Methyltransferase n=1 Tax=Pelagibacterium halotolerans (strain DSM 22347 / JCM 15775 / CGMCC 1.7692 / B2) TaxID=1082931 RepID=G4R965_PELHB|nr:RNA methyltransferase [Pelagibacterium halotolerans]AEQ52445.1 methyltransferase [Pelagibacterium halotolerans B2]QJR17824.1 RNA methyltransferase [Pelagibacterium halotolerans]SEA36699.1 putative N6-adenine-specific DNA methylase [Pelagibacterium halotolerans]